MKRDDRLAPLVYLAFGPLTLLTAVFGPLLVLFPDSTRTYWAWEIKPAMSAVWVGAGYTFGALAIATMLIVGRWRASIVAVIGTWPFSISLLIATLMHWDRFFQGTINFYVWFAIYLGLPILLPVMWWLNRGRDPGPQPDDLVLPRPLCLAGVTLGAVLAALSMLMLVSPEAAAGFWPWQLTPLMARVVAAWIMFLGAGLLCLSFERRYIAYRQYLPSASVWFAILFVASFFHQDNFPSGLAAAWPWLLITAAVPLVTLAILVYYESRLRLFTQHEPAQAAV